MTNNLKLIAIATIGLSFGAAFAADDAGAAAPAEANPALAAITARFKRQFDERVAGVREAAAEEARVATAEAEEARVATAEAEEARVAKELEYYNEKRDAAGLDAVTEMGRWTPVIEAEAARARAAGVDAANDAFMRIISGSGE